jgi:tRNA pseudouridine65 synthase
MAAEGPAAPAALPPLAVLWRDDRLVAIHKPAGWLVHRSALDPHERRVVLQHLRDQLGAPVHPVHRLDKGTSGVLLLALDTEAASDLGRQWMAQGVRKDYLAFVRGWPPEAAEVDHPLRPDDAPPDAPAQPARSSVRRLATLALDEPVDGYEQTRAALVWVRPHTGRRHQVRRHLKHLAHPILGDATHGKGAHNRRWAERLGVARLWLHAWRLRVRHPDDGRLLELEAAPDAPHHADWAALAAHPGWTSPWDLPAPGPDEVD